MRTPSACGLPAKCIIYCISYEKCVCANCILCSRHNVWTQRSGYFVVYLSTPLLFTSCVIEYDEHVQIELTVAFAIFDLRSAGKPIFFYKIYL